MVAIDRNRALRSDSAIADKGGNRNRRNVISASIINIEVMIIEVMIINRRWRGRANRRLIITSGYRPPRDSLILSVLNRLPLIFAQNYHCLGDTYGLILRANKVTLG